MKISGFNTRLGMLATLTIGVLVTMTVPSVAMATPAGHCGHEQMSSEKMHEQMKAGLDKLEGRLEIRSSQLGAWEEFAKSVEMLRQETQKRPNDDADAATIAHYRAEWAGEFAEKLTAIADATDKLQESLTDDQRKVLNQAARHFLHAGHGWKHRTHGSCRESHEREQRGHHDDKEKDS
jgi:hypothetical protein